MHGALTSGRVVVVLRGAAAALPGGRLLPRAVLVGHPVERVHLLHPVPDLGVRLSLLALLPLARLRFD